MLETAEERIKLLKAGYSDREIERLYIEYNNFKISRTPAVIELVECDMPQDKRICMTREAASEYV